MEHGVKGEKTCFCSESHLLKPPSEGAGTSPPPSPANSHEGSESEKARGGASMAATSHPVKRSERLKGKNVNIPQSNYWKLLDEAALTPDGNY